MGNSAPEPAIFSFNHQELCGAVTRLGRGRQGRAASMGRAGGPNPARIAAIRGPVPRILMTRVRLQASTCRDISVATLGSLFIRKCVAPIRALMVPHACSNVSHRPPTLLLE